MDRTSIIVLGICLAILALWYTVVIPKLTPKHVPGAATNAPVATATPTNQTSNYQPAASSVTTTSNSLALVVNMNIDEDLMVVTNENARYTFTSRGGGLKLVELVHYPETVSTRREQRGETNRVATLNAFTPAPTLELL